MIRILVIAKNIVMYRANLLREIQKNLPDSEITIMYSDEITDLHGWSNLDELKDYQLEFIHAKTGDNNGIFIKCLRKLFSRHDGAFKTFPTKLLKDIELPDIVWIHEFNEYTIPVLFKYRKKSKILLSTEVGTSKEIITYNWSTYFIHRCFGKFIDGIVARSRSAFHTPCVKNKPIAFAPYGIDTEGYCDEVDRDTGSVCRFIYTGQYIHRKGIDLLADACKRLLEDGIDNFEVALYGSGDDDLVDEIISSRGISKVMHKAGFCLSTDLPQKYMQSDVFVLPTRADTHAVVVHEAATCGIALLVSQFAGSAQLLVNDENGYIVDPHDTEDLASKMRTLIENPEVCKKMGRSAEVKAKELCVRESGKNIAQFINEKIL